jgi:hypothetical protein
MYASFCTTHVLNIIRTISTSCKSFADPSQELLRLSSGKPQNEDISNGYQALDRVLRNINFAIRHQELQEAQSDLMARIQDWQNLNLDSFGQLRQFDVLNVVTGKSDVQHTVCTLILQTTTRLLVLPLS